MGGAQDGRASGAGAGAGAVIDFAGLLPDSLVVLWRALAMASRVIPMRELDAAYDLVARVRLRIFAPPDSACPIVGKDLRSRLLA